MDSAAIMLVSPSMSSRSRELIRGVIYAVLICLVASGAVQLFFASTYAQTPPLFSVTLLTRTGDEVRLQYSSIIANNMISLGIDAKLEFIDFDALSTRLFFRNSPQGALYNQGGYDMGILEWDANYGDPIPDWIRSNFDSRPLYLAPSGYNYALYNSTELNSLFNQLNTSTDTQTKIDLVHKWQEIVFRDSPYAYVWNLGNFALRNQKWSAWGGKDVYNTATFPDIQHYSGGSNYTLRVGSSFNKTGVNLDPAFTNYSPTPVLAYYAILFQIIKSGGGLLDVDSRDLSFYPALATNITASPDGLDWTVQIRKGALWQSGVEITADDFVWTRWVEFNSKNPASSRLTDVGNLGNVIDFTFLNGTTVTVDNRASANETIRHSLWKTVDRYTFQFHLSQPYAWTRETYLGTLSYPLPKHIMERFPQETWDQQPFSTANAPYTYTWDTTQYGGTGSYRAVGPVGDGPYYLQSYNSTSNVATLKKFHQYWNATELEGLGQFTVETYNVVLMTNKAAALEALKSREIDQMMGFISGADRSTLQALGVNVISVPYLSWQEVGFNMRQPVFGTGVDTPLGKSDPSMAADAARHVRKAISHLIPRDKIVNEISGGAGFPLASFLGPEWGVWYNRDLKPDSYDNNTAAAELRAAGYTVGGISTLAPTQSSPFWLIGGVVVAAVGLTSSMVVVVRKRKKQGAVTSQRMLSTGYADLEGLLHGGIPVGYAVLLISPPCDERDLLLRKMLKANLSSGMQVFHVSGDLARTQDLVAKFPKDFYAFCPEAHRVASGDQNLYEIPGVGNLVEFNIVLNKGLNEKVKEGKQRVIVMDLLSDLLLRHKGVMTRKWLGEFIGKRKAQGFTTICILNPNVSSKEEIGRITDLFDGIIEIYEKQVEGGMNQYLVIRKMYGQDYSRTELLLDRSKLM